MWHLEKQMLGLYPNIKPKELVLGNKYLLIKKNYKLFGEFKGFHRNTNYILIKNDICNVSLTGFKIFSLLNIRKRQIQRYFRDKLPYEINMIIAEKC